ncbi:beclin 1 [Lachancea thermotolerans CBS 6340]|uniref:KLTH0D09900p n=1 Tax=Lachancea thermotolerans (strain ATCC 56472 / CBS 6340 / NRRL Y-8284) TaxID=559295 RepID=C5DEU7_LACTC|nr:KLTH0D09900p [Lachancea thermotolerans CBS 6340]CAR22702.1 KLTH0D09900p [Lachancea thermotolerans CBS 6340]
MGDDEVLKCQNCQVPLEIDSSLIDLSLAQRSLLMNTATEPSVPTGIIPPDRLRRLGSVKKGGSLNLQPSVLNSLDSYVFLGGESSTLQQTRWDGESGDEADDSATTKTLSSRVGTLTNIFNVLSSKSNIDYPVCQDCCDLLIQKLKGEYEEALKERDTYSEFLYRLKKQRELESYATSKPHMVSESGGVDTKKEQEELLNELIELEKTEAELDSTIEDLESELQAKNDQEIAELEVMNSRDLEKLEFMSELQSLKNQYESTLNNLDKLRKTNVYNETFRISHDGPFGTINGMRLGGLDDKPIPWQEINGALGQVILLLATICARLKFKLNGYVLRPMGSFSKIEKLDPKDQEWHSYDAFSDGSFKLGRFFHKETSFDRAMVSILEVISQITSRLSMERSSDSEEIELPYNMHGDKINGMAVKLCGNKPGLEWTTACKFVLTNCKWLLAFSSSMINDF